MATLMLRLAGPIQSWGDDSKFETRRTAPFPTKSGVIGMIASAMGISRDEPLDRFYSLKFGVRVDREGELTRDYHIARREKQTYVTNRYYLCDAVFVVAIESDDEGFIREIETALKNPYYPLFLGRRSCPPTMPLVLGVREDGLMESLKNEPWQLDNKRQKYESGELRIIADDNSSEGKVYVRDMPISFSQKKREFGWRKVKDYGYISVKKDDIEIQPTEHDPFDSLV